MAIDKLIGLKIAVKVDGLDQLNQYEALVKRITEANIKLAKAQNNPLLAASTAAQARNFFSANGKPFAESAFLSKQEQATRQAERAQAQLAAQLGINEKQTRNFVGALKILGQAIQQATDPLTKARLVGQQASARAANERAVLAQQRADQIAADRAERIAVGRAVAAAQAARYSGDRQGALSALSGAGLPAGSLGAQRLNASQVRLQAIFNAEDVRQQARTSAAAARTERDYVRQTIAQARVIRQTGDYRREIDLLNTALGRLSAGSTNYLRVQERLGNAKATQADQPGILNRLGSGFVTAFNGFTRITAAIFLLRAALNTIGGLVTSTFVDPLLNVATLILDATDKFRRLEITLGGITGSRSSAKGVVADVFAAARGLPITGSEALSTVVKTGFNNTNALSIIRPDGRQDRIRDLLNIITKLGVIDPEQGPEGAQFAIREALSGQFRSLRTRFEISPEAIAQAGGTDLKGLAKDPGKFITSLKTFLDQFVGDAAIKDYNELLSTQGNKIKDLLDQFFAVSGEQGFYDKVVGFLKNLNAGIEQGLDDFRAGRGGALSVAAKTINDALTQLFNSILDSGSSIIGGIIGKKVDLRGSISSGDIGTIAAAGGDLIAALSQITRQLVVVGGDLIGAVSGVARTLGVIGSLDPAELQQQIVTEQRAIAQLNASLNGNSGGFLDGVRNGLSSAFPFAGAALSNVIGPTGGQAVGQLAIRQENLTNLVRRRNALIGAPDGPSLDPAVEAAQARARAIQARFGDIPSEQARFGSIGRSQFGTALQGLRGLDERDVPPSVKSSRVFNARNSSAGIIDQALDRAIDSLNDLPAGAQQTAGRLQAIERARAQLASLQTENTEAQRRLIVDGEQNLSRLSTSGQIKEGNALFNGFLGSLIARNRFASGRDNDPQLAQIRGLLGQPDENGALRLESGQLSPDAVSPDVFSLDQLPSILSIRNQAQRKESSILGDQSARARSRNGLEQLRAELVEFGKTSTSSVEGLNEAIAKIDDELLNASINIQDTLANLQQTFEDFTSSVSGGFQTAFSDTLVQSFDGASIKIVDILKNLEKTIQKSIADALVQATLIQGILNPVLNRAFGTNSPTNDLFGLGQNAVNQFGPGILGIGRGPGISPGAGVSNSPLPNFGPTSFQLNANTGLARGGIFGAAAGIITRPNTMIRTAEDGTPEVLTPNAVIPLRGNSMAGVLSGPSRREQQPVVVNLVNVLEPSDIVRRGIGADPNVIINPVAKDMRSRGNTSRSVRKVVG